MKQFNEEQKVEAIKSSKDKITIIKIVPYIASTVAIALVVTFLILYKPISSMEGVWVRQPDDNPSANGMVIEVKKQNGLYVGEVIAIDDETEMPIGTIKWQGFQKDALNVFAYYDSSMSSNPAEREFGVSYGLMSWDRKKLTLYCPNVSRGQSQLWIRQ